MITWLLFTLFTPVGTANIYSCAWCGVMLDMFLFGQIYQKIEKIIDKRRKTK
jgi:hypothetical protein